MSVLTLKLMVSIGMITEYIAYQGILKYTMETLYFKYYTRPKQKILSLENEISLFRF